MELRKNAIGFCAILILIVSQASAQFLWTENGVPLRDDLQMDWYDQWAAVNGSGDIYIVWQDSRGQYPSIYAQKFNSQGVPLWAHDVELVRDNLVQMVICPTSDDGLVVAWGVYVPYTHGIIKAQKMDAAGNVLWDPTGVFVGRYIYAPGADGNDRKGNSDGSYSDYNLVADSAGGIFALWTVETHSNQADLFAKHLLADGSIAPGWNPLGNVLKSDVNFLQYGSRQSSCSDDAGGFIVSWLEYLGNNYYDVYAQRVDGAGNLYWGINGLELCPTASYYTSAVARDGTGGAFFVWEDIRSGGTMYDLWMQRVDPQGNILWQTNGIPLIQAFSNQVAPKMISDEAGGALIAWIDGRNPTYDDIYCQRVNGQGNLLWSPAGVALTVAAGSDHYPNLTSDGNGGLLATWIHWTSSGYSYRDAYLQHLLPDGQAAWQPNGILLRGGDHNCVYLATVVGSGTEGALYFWSEKKHDLEGLYLQKTNALGQFQFPPEGETVEEAITGEVEGFTLTSITPNRYLTVWTDTRRTIDVGRLLYYQVFDSTGQVLLLDNGVLLSPYADDDQNYAQATATADDGAIVVWQDWRHPGGNARLYAQKIDAQGHRLWLPEGVRLSYGQDNAQSGQFICTDDAGGAYIAFADYYGDIFIQRLNGSGSRLFGETALRLTSSLVDESLVNLVPDGAGGALVIYEIWPGTALYAKRVLPSGVTAWTVTIYDPPQSPGEQVVIRAQAGGAIIVWESSYVSDIYAQKFDNSGTLLWGENGVPVVVGAGVQHDPSMVEDEDGYVYIAWVHGYADLYCQRLSPEGVPQFPEAGLLLSNAPEYQDGVQLLADGSGGAIFTWTDDRDMWTTGSDIYAQHLNAQGQIANPLWVPNGNPVCDAPGWEGGILMVPDGANGTVLAWGDSRGLYAQRINDAIVQDGTLTNRGIPSKIELLPSSPNPFNPSTAISYQLPATGYVSLQVYDTTGRLVETLVEGWREVGVHEVTFDGTGLASGVYLARLLAGDLHAVQKLLLLK